MTNLKTLFEKAVRLHQSGLPHDAITIYLQILAIDSNNPYLLFLVGSAFSQIGKHEEGVSHLQKSAKTSPNPITYNNLAGSLVALGRHKEAIQYLRIATELDPSYSEGFCNLGIAQRAAGLLKDSLNSLEQATRLTPNYRLAFTEKGITFSSLGDYAKSIESQIQASKLDPTFPGSYHLIGDALIKLGRTTDSLSYFEKAIELKTNFFEAYISRGGALKKLGRFEESLADYNTAIELKSDFAEAYSNRGNTLKELHRFDEALADYNTAIELKPDFAEAYNNRGNTLKELHRFDEALADYNTAIEFKPDFAEAYNNRGNTLKELHRFDEALADYNTAIEFKPDYAEAYWNKSLLLILTGQYEEGWKLYEWRFEYTETKHNHYQFPQLSWRGKEDIEGKRLFVYSEQGLGDVIQFCRYLNQIRALGAEIILEAPKTLIPLVSTLDCKMSIIAKGDEQPEFDAYCPVMSLPLVFKTNLKTIPNSTPYLFADQQKVKHWQEKFGPKERLRVGIAWSGSLTHKNDKNRSIKLERLTSLLSLPVEYHSIQKEYRPYDIDVLQQTQIVQHQDELNDFSDTAALIECMDLVISVDTSVAHVAGALGKPVWIILPYTPDYRWMLDKNDSPWYPTAKIFRQSNIDDWDSSVKLVYENLHQLVM